MLSLCGVKAFFLFVRFDNTVLSRLAGRSLRPVAVDILETLPSALFFRFYLVQYSTLSPFSRHALNGACASLCKIFSTGLWRSSGVRSSSR